MVRILLIFIWFITISTSIAQIDTTATDSVPKAAVDSSEIAQNNFQKKLENLERQRLIDSIKKAELEERIKDLKNSDPTEKNKLQEQINALNANETQRLEQKKKEIEALRKSTKGHPVFGFFDDTLFNIYTKLGSFSAKERADAVTRRINKLPENLAFTTDSLLINTAENASDIVYGEHIIMSVSQNDALWENTTTEALAVSYRDAIATSVTNYREETNIWTLAKEIGLALLVLVAIWFLIKYIIRFFRWSAKKIEQQEDKRIKGVKLKDYTLFDAKRQVTALLLVNKVFKWFVILLAIYIALPILFGIFPWTRNFADTLFGYVLNPVKSILLSIWNYLPNLITIIVIVLVFRYVLKGLRFLSMEIMRGNLKINGFYPDWARPTYQIVRVLVIAFMIVSIWGYIPGSDSPIFQGISVFLGFLFTFGSAGSLSNIIAGLVLTYMRLFKIGDRVKIGEVFGDVIEKSSLVTRVRTPKNEIISIPNSTVMSSHTINYSSDAPEKGLIIHTTVTIGYDVPWKKMHAALIEAAKRTELVVENPEPFVLQTSLEDFYVAYQINAYIKEANKQATIYSNLHQNIQDVCNEQGIEILSPHYRAARDGNMSTIPENYLPKDYKAPSFNVKQQKE
ncbi:mechanosensitive ion channel domain-containing protein [Marinirhabdus gelatinilytica]|uniref:Mechanosensitive ion channel-like protein n=1 Tax=Marinirhabdus gelatinilytica TaxID=1703343 RepID=A0A370QC06_9FLAO|nr:mechanosensitive ion channel domain-containing protein [Marinirhabdus gelatinilytica]RDK85530.1 mechanosensitive ion channel-like protein [Marinirhabdus gelatinilytica]